MIRCILDHYQFDPKDQGNIISLFGIFPHFVSEGRNVFSGNSRYVEWKRHFDYRDDLFYATTINDKLQGVYLHKRGAHIKVVGEYKDGKREGLWQYYGDNERLREQGMYHDGRKEGVWETWDGSRYNDLIKKEEYQNGRVNGLVEEFQNGILKSKGLIRDGRMEGPWQIAEKLPNDSIVLTLGDFKDGRKIGVWETWDRNGNFISSREWKEGEWKDWEDLI